MKHSYAEYIERAKRQHGARFNADGLSRQFVPYFESGDRIKVETCGETVTGTVGVTTGRAPCFLLMRTSRSIGSSITLSDRDRIVGVKRGRRYA